MNGPGVEKKVGNTNSKAELSVDFLYFAVSALTLLVGCQEAHPACKTEWWGVDVVICLEQGANCLHIVKLMPLHPKTQSSLALF